MKPLRLVILCGQSARHLHIANALCAVADVQAIVQETGTEWTAKKLKRFLHPANLGRKAWRWLRDRKRYTGNPEAKWFFGDRPPALDRADLRVLVPHINHQDVLALVDRIQPDLIAVFGTSLIRGELLKRGRLGIANLHGGLSPEYRGADCTFWALHNGEPDKIGCTLHWIDAGIDTGGLIAHISPAIRPDDAELPLFWRAVEDSAKVYAEFVQRLARGERFGRKQPGKGRLYQVKMRGLAHEQKVDQLLKDGLLARFPLGPRVTWFQPDP